MHVLCVIIILLLYYLEKVVIYTNTVTFTHLNYVTLRGICSSVHLSVCLFLSVCLCLPVCLFTLKASLQKYPRNTCGYPSQKMKISETSQIQPPNVRFFLLYICLICTEYVLYLWSMLCSVLFTSVLSSL